VFTKVTISPVGPDPIGAAFELPPDFSGTPFYLRGSMNQWSVKDRLLAAGPAQYAVKLMLEPGVHEFKIGSEDFSTIDFGASDAPMTDEQLAAAKGGPIFHIPTALGAIVMTYNIPNNKTKLKFTGATIAGIFLGDISKWNDPKLVADNPDLAHVNQDIVVVHRSDGSGTSFGFTDYLSTVSPDWQSKVGKGTSVSWPVGLGGSGNPGVAGEVQQNPYSIGYVELIYALGNKLDYGSVKNKASQWIDPSLDSVTAAATAALQTIPADLRFSIVDASGDTSYSISTATWLLAYKNQTDQPKALALTRLLWWATHDAQTFNKDLQYAVVPAGLTVKSEQFIRQIVVNGKPVLP